MHLSHIIIYSNKDIDKTKTSNPPSSRIIIQENYEQKNFLHKKGLETANKTIFKDTYRLQ